MPMPRLSLVNAVQLETHNMQYSNWSQIVMQPDVYATFILVNTLASECFGLLCRCRTWSRKVGVALDFHDHPLEYICDQSARI